MSEFVKNLWYVAAWRHEIARILLARTLLDIGIVFYRREDGTPVALEDRCPHRFAPLHLGTLEGDAVRCGYHGLCFGPSGACTENPHGGPIPAAARVRSFPLAERHGLVWIWPGDAAAADPDLIPDFGHLESPSHRTLSGVMVARAHHSLVADNLLDLSHTEYVHKSFLQSSVVGGRSEVIQDGEQLLLKLRRVTDQVPQLMRRDMPDDAEAEIWFNIRWIPPGLIRLEAGMDFVGGPANPSANIGTHLLTPETKTSTHYFYASSRTERLDDAEMDEKIRTWHRIGFGEQDKPMIEAVQAKMAGADLMSLDPVLLKIDAGPIRARRIMAELLARETASSARKMDEPKSLSA